jgi:hypothetical protein
MKRNIIAVGVEHNEPLVFSASALIGEKVLKGRVQDADRFTFTPTQYRPKSFNGIEGGSWQTEDITY